MKSAPVSFGSMLVFTIDDNKPKASVPDLMKASFKNNPALKKYNLTDTFKFQEEEIDGTVHNAAKNFCDRLDIKYKKQLPNGSKKVILTEADFFVDPRHTQKRYFLTAATDDDEKKIHSALSKSSIFYTARFGFKNKQK